MSYPRVVFKNGGPHQRHGGSYDQMIVADDTELMKAMDDGWFFTLPEAIEGKHAEKTEKKIESADEYKPITRDELEMKAKELGIKFDGRTSDLKLIDKIEEALKALEE